MLSVLDRVEAIARTIPPVDNKASRFGNPAFKTFYDRVLEVCLLEQTDSRFGISCMSMVGIDLTSRDFAGIAKGCDPRGEGALRGVQG